MTDTFDGGCARCGDDVPAYAVIGGESLCDACLRDEIERTRADMVDGQLHFDDMVLRPLRPLRPFDEPIQCEEIRSPLLCGDDE